jgi:hypothetical protein
MDETALCLVEYTDRSAAPNAAYLIKCTVTVIPTMRSCLASMRAIAPIPAADDSPPAAAVH